jgi:hypothetical protein
MTGKQMARTLGWFSVGLGLAEVVAPRRLGKLIGVQGYERLVRTIGMREIAAGVGLLTARATANNRSKWMWARIGGDAIDLALLGLALKANGTSLNGNNRGRTLAAIGAVAPVVAVDLLCARQLMRQALEETHARAEALV